MLPVGQAQAALAAACGPNRWAANTLPFANGKEEVMHAGSPLRASQGTSVVRHGSEALAEQLADNWHVLAQPCLQGKLAEQAEKHASAGNRTRVTSMATMYSTTRPLMLMLSVISALPCRAFSLPSAQPGPSKCPRVLSKPCVRASLRGRAHAGISSVSLARTRPYRFERPSF